MSAMATVVAIMSMSLDGYVAGPNDGVAEVFISPTSLAATLAERYIGVTRLPIFVETKDRYRGSRATSVP